jgi:plastocyanin
MQAKRLIALPLVCAFLGFSVLAGCGGGGDSSSSTRGESSGASAEGASTETTKDTSGEPEPGDDSGGNAPAPSGDAVRSAKVEIEDYAYNPDPVTIEEGGKVTWINKDSVAHTATAEDGSFDTGPIEEGKLKSETFKQPGTYEYVCSIHPTMHGTIEVVEAG